MMHSTNKRAIPFFDAMCFIILAAVILDMLWVAVVFSILWAICTDEWREVHIIYSVDDVECSGLLTLEDKFTPGRRFNKAIHLVTAEAVKEAIDKGEPTPKIVVRHVSESNILYFWRVPKFLMRKKQAEQNA